jgi:hypothetical protein
MVGHERGVMWASFTQLPTPSEFKLLSSLTFCAMVDNN